MKLFSSKHHLGAFSISFVLCCFLLLLDSSTALPLCLNSTQVCILFLHLPLNFEFCVGYEGSGGQLEHDVSSPFVDLTDQVHFDTQLGMMGMTFHPNFANYGRFFASFNCDSSLDILKVLMHLKPQYTEHLRNHNSTISIQQ
ncbi:hypothetical protein VIGAN_01465600 [Vigna angularis var. angularis]|uniref:Legume lectin domain-containing protein n=1 Tax=Vigna angularis var. angularis TaxID=157739 RepID=A0A0S3R7I0_PHAAN|nr:hypothetical protein VIGAN_01465600 [Vigna angularis var. angularis]